VHNLDFDGFLILEEISKYKKFKIDFLIHKMKIYYIKIIFSAHVLEFRCSKKILPLSLSNIARDFDLPPKLNYPYTFLSEKTLYFKKKLIWDNKDWGDIDIMEYTIKYCLRDVEITKKFIETLRLILLNDQKIDILHVLSSSSLSLKVFSKNFNTKKLSLKMNNNLDSLIREGYFGGRVEIFGNTNEKVYHYDFPGMYGLCMREKFPFGKIRIVLGKNIDPHKLLPGFYTISWKSDNFRIPILPVKNESGKLIFPNGKHSGTYWFEEIITFMKHGGQIINIDRGIIYEDYDYVFNDFVDYFDTFRKKGGSYKILGKLIINSLYGKMGSGIKNTEYLVAYSEKEIEDIKKKNKVIKISQLNSIFIVEIEVKTKKKGINVGLAAAITSKARIKLVESMIKIEKKGGRMLYCDTDSIFVEFKENVDESLFKWDKEDSIIDSAIFALPKTYALKIKDKTITKIKGIPKSNISFDDFKNRFLNGEFLTFQEIFQIRKNEFKIFKKSGDKKINLSIYDKRKFNLEKNNTFV
jgi:hypothetical protein